jgi:glutamine synthetase
MALHRVQVRFVFPRQTEADGYGYLEDRRPASNCDPYMVTEAIVRTTCLNVAKLSRSYSSSDGEKIRQQLNDAGHH